MDTIKGKKLEDTIMGHNYGTSGVGQPKKGNKVSYVELLTNPRVDRYYM